MRLLEFASNTHSQTGEDGVLAKILETLPERDQWCVEFGAWDGRHLSNTCNLIENQGYSAVLIEADPKRFQDLLADRGKNPKIFGINRFVGFGSDDSLDVLLKDTPIPVNFDLLSIDIDGNDYHAWAATSHYSPKVVCIEFNLTIPTEVEFVQPADPNVCQGSSLLSLTLLGRKKGYELVAVTRLNAIFVQAEYFPLFGIANNEPRVLREDTSTVTHIFNGYDGTIFIRGSETVQWHGLRYANRVAQLPRIFRHLPETYGPAKAFVYRVYKQLLRLLKRG